MSIPMGIGSLIATVILALLVLTVAILMPYAIARNLKGGHAFRNKLDDELSSLRLSNMLGFLGINKAEYLHKQQALDIKQHMSKCDACDEKELCDDTLGSEAVNKEIDLSFCANIDSLQKIDKRSGTAV